MKQISKIITLVLVLIFLIPQNFVFAAGVISLTSSGVAYTQNFNTLAFSGTSSTVPNGWDFYESGSGANSTYGTGTGSSNVGNTYSFGDTSSSERAVGGLQSGSLEPTIGVQFGNTTGDVINSLSISYTGEQWRLGATGREDRLDFQLSTNATSLTTGTWVDYNNLDFVAPVTTGTTGTLNGNASANQSAKNYTITGLSIPNNSTFWIRWIDFNASGADDGLAVDDFSLTSYSNAPVVTSILRASANPTNSSSVYFNVTFSKPVTGVDTADFSAYLSGITGASVTNVSGSGTAYTVSVNTGTGSGTLRLDIVDNDTIVDVLSTPLGGAGAANGDYTSGESYTINKAAPTQAGGVIINEVSNGTSGAREWIELLVIGPAATVDLSGWIIDDNNGDFDSFATGKGIAAGHLRFADSIPACATGHSLAAAPLGSRIVIYNAADAEGALASFPNDPCDSNGDGVYFLPVGDNPNNSTVLQQCTDTPRISPSPASLDYSGCTYASPATSWAPLSLANTGDAIQARTPDAIFYHGFAYGNLTVPPAPNFPDGNPSFNVNASTGTDMAYQFQCGNYFSNNAGQFLRLNAGLANPGAVNNLGNAVFLRSMQLGTYNYADLNDVENCRIEPQVSMSFLQSQVTAGQQAQLSITLTNPYESIDGFILDLLGIQFTNTLPVGMTLSGANPVSNTCGGMFTGTSGASSFSLSGVALPTVAQPSSNTCTIVVNVIPQNSGEFTNELLAGSVSSVALGAGGGSNIDPASATLLVDAAPPVADLPDTLPSTGFAPGKITALPDQTIAKTYTQFDGLMLEIPKIAVQTTIVGIPVTDENWDLTWLDGQAGWLNGTAFPTWSGNSVITGHVWNALNSPGPFANLAQLSYGDKIIVHAWGQDYIYEVRSMEKYVSPTDTSVFTHQDLPWITLITCQGYNEKSDSYRWRMVVRAVLVEVK